MDIPRFQFLDFEKSTFLENVAFRADRRNVCMCMQMTNGCMENARMSIWKNVDVIAKIGSDMQMD